MWWPSKEGGNSTFEGGEGEREEVIIVSGSITTLIPPSILKIIKRRALNTDQKTALITDRKNIPGTLIPPDNWKNPSAKSESPRFANKFASSPITSKYIKPKIIPIRRKTIKTIFDTDQISICRIR